MQVHFDDFTTEQQIIYLLRRFTIQLIFSADYSANFEMLLPYGDLSDDIYDALLDIRTQTKFVWHHRMQKIYDEPITFMHKIYIHKEIV